MIIFIVGSKFCTQIFQMGMRFSLLAMLSLYWDIEECPEKKTRADFPSGSLLNLNEEVDYSKGMPELAGP